MAVDTRSRYSATDKRLHCITLDVILTVTVITVRADKNAMCWMIFHLLSSSSRLCGCIANQQRRPRERKQTWWTPDDGESGVSLARSRGSGTPTICNYTLYGVAQDARKPAGVASNTGHGDPRARWGSYGERRPRVVSVAPVDVSRNEGPGDGRDRWKGGGRLCGWTPRGGWTGRGYLKTRANPDHGASDKTCPEE